MNKSTVTVKLLRKKLIGFSILYGMLLIPASCGVDLYVSLNGSDANSGILCEPLESLAAVQKKTRSYTGKELVTVHVADGVYYLPETLVFTSEDSGTADVGVYRVEVE